MTVAGPVPLPADGEIDIRLVSMAVADAELARLRDLLTDEELQRGERLLDKERRDHFFVGRGMLREALGGYLGQEPADVRLLQGEFGKPQLHRDHSEGISFNISHAGGYLLLAFTVGREIGVDLEEVRRELPFRAMAERYFSAREKEELFSLTPAKQVDAFYRCWTRKEAYMKATGTGFSQPSTGFDVSLLPGAPPTLLAHRGDPGETQRWSIRGIETPPGFCAAIAIETSRTASHGDTEATEKPRTERLEPESLL